MSVIETPEPSLRPNRFEHKRLAWAFVVSLAVHLAGYGGYQFTRLVLPGMLERVKLLAALAEALKPKQHAPPQPTEAPLVFVDVNPETATPDPPKDAKYYSSKNSKAANPEDGNSDVPKI